MVQDVNKTFLLETNEHNFKIGDVLRVDSNKIFSYKIVDLMVWHKETVLCIVPNEPLFDDCERLLLTRYETIYKEVSK